MTAIRNSVGSSANFRQPRRDRRPSAAAVWQWVLRLVLPLLAAMGSVVLYWIWFDNVYGRHWGNTVGGIALAVAMFLVLIWSICTWLSDAS